MNFWAARKGRRFPNLLNRSQHTKLGEQYFTNGPVSNERAQILLIRASSPSLGDVKHRSRGAID